MPKRKRESVKQNSQKKTNNTSKKPRQVASKRKPQFTPKTNKKPNNDRATKNNIVDLTKQEENVKQPQKTIYFYDEKATYGELSNFYKLRTPLSYLGKEYPTSEHLYQALRFLSTDSEVNDDYAEEIRTQPTPYKAKILSNEEIGGGYPWRSQLNKIITRYQARGIKVREDWDVVVDDMMLLALRLKFNTDSRCRDVLLRTGSAALAEHTDRDVYWADGGDGSGLNMLGKLLMRVREELRQGESAS
eukprot:TRINITY_DN2649_c0_g2_i1.p1 TRINITY_DN2649_c0_g2~~TRINITY_DN2649_c0_g2_i1.p1  ORF type:complete len:246 (+),score=41.09 TRINITY_DN2649_c0_g2_i1:75-812(+)